LSSGVLPARRADGRHQARFQLALVARFGKAGQLLELVFDEHRIDFLRTARDRLHVLQQTRNEVAFFFCSIDSVNKT
jgi:hypothetical protein